jgi:hypothetical protein
VFDCLLLTLFSILTDYDLNQYNIANIKIIELIISTPINIPIQSSPNLVSLSVELGSDTAFYIDPRLNMSILVSSLGEYE